VRLHVPCVSDLIALSLSLSLAHALALALAFSLALALTLSFPSRRPACDWPAFHHAHVRLLGELLSVVFS
jgi:hypothetical protein